MSIDNELMSPEAPPPRPNWLTPDDAAVEPVLAETAVDLDEADFVPEENADFAEWDGLEEFDDAGADFDEDSAASAESFFVPAEPIDDVILLDIDDSDEILAGEQAGRRMSWPAVIATAVLHVWLITTLAGITNEKPEWIYDRFIDSRMEVSEIPDSFPHWRR